MPISPLDASALRWSCPSSWLDFGSTDDLEPSDGLAGQESAVDALEFGLTVLGHGQHVYVRSEPATGRVTLVRSVLERVQLRGRPEPDRCYVHNFTQPDQPRLVSLPAGQGPVFAKRVREMIRFIQEDLTELLGSARMVGATERLEDEAEEAIRELSAGFDAEVAAAGLAVVQIEDDDDDEPASYVMPMIGEQPVPFEQLEEMAEPPIPAHQLQALRSKAEELTERLRKLSVQAVRLQRRSQREIRRLVSGEAMRILRDAVADMRRPFAVVDDWLDAVIDDVSSQLPALVEKPQVANRYQVNVLHTRGPDEPPPVVVENVPTLQRLLGGVDPVVDEDLAIAPHMGIHAGSLLRASGGVLILRAREIYSEPGAWAALKRTLRTERIELTPAEHHATTVRFAGVKPEAVKFRVKVVLIGDVEAYHFLDLTDDDFSQLFKVLVDVSHVVPRERRTARLYGQVLARLVKREELLPFDASAVGALVEHGARIVAERGQLTARFGRVADIAREADWHARRRQVDRVHGQDVEMAVLSGKRRADRPGRRFRQRAASGEIKVWTRGTEVGQVNGLAVIQAGPLSYGFPTRVTASIGPGRVGAIHVEKEAALSGQIHTKGFLIQRGLLRRLLATEHPLIFDASLTHEQSYGGIDGDSASGVELICLVSALTGVPVKQGIAMTGAIDQLGNILPIGAVNEKIEGFFDLCAHLGLDGEQGVIIPDSNAGDLQLRRDVVEACRAGRFHIWKVGQLTEAMELFTAMPADELLELARSRARELWDQGQADVD